MWEAFTNFITNILVGIHGFCGDWGLAIIILTLIVRLLIMPLMTRSTRSSAKMQVLQPKMKELQDRYADDPERLRQEMSKFYSENKFNPMGGCLPMLLTFPILWAIPTPPRMRSGSSVTTVSVWRWMRWPPISRNRRCSR